MPPSHHSSGSHHSSSSHRSSSSHHSSSSHRSSSSRSLSSSYRSSSSRSSSSSFGSSGYSSSGPSRHSSGPSAHSSASHHSSTSSARFAGNNGIFDMNAARSRATDYRAAQAITAAQISRARHRNNQPSGYTRFTPNYVAPRMHRCSNHDYMFYPTDWTDPATGQTYNKGYYDEEGQYYEKIALFNKNTGKYESKLVCNFCGCEVKAEWDKGSAPKCPNCAGSMEEVITGIMYDDELEWFYMPDMTLTPEEEMNMSAAAAVTSATSGKKKGAKIAVPVAIVAVIALICCMCPVFGACPTTSPYVVNSLNSMTDKLNGVTEALEEYDDGDFGYSSQSYDEEIPPLYVDEIGRECKWIDEYESYYDPVSDCYFWYYDDGEYGEWQYWYEGISSDYGDYGWMEYDYDEDAWYIQISDTEWELLPEEYDTSGLWHFE